MDRNSVIGFVLLLALATGYIFYSNNSAKEYQAKKTADSLAYAKAHPQPAANTAVLKDTTTVVDSSLPTAFRGAEQMVTVSNGLIDLKVTSKGAFPVEANLVKFKTYSQKPLLLFSGKPGNRLAFKIPVNGKDIWSDELNFTPEQKTAADGSPQLVMTADVGAGKSVVMTYTLPKDGYMMDASLRLIGMADGLSKTTEIPVEWKTTALSTEKDLKNERTNAQIHFRYQSGEHDYNTVSRKPKKSMDESLQWMGVKTHFFNSTIIAAEKPFKKGSYDAAEPNDSSIVATDLSTMTIPVAASNDFAFNFRWYIGPNDYNTLKSYNYEMEEMIPLGFGIFFFVKYIAKWAIIPLFNVLSSFISNFGILIIVMTLIIRFVLSFFTYKSQLSSAKMRVLKPELDELKAKYADNQQQFGMEQMKLYRTAGVNPLGGCLPLLLQMPFLLAMYYVFPTAIQLRQAKFLWADDLSTYDNILNLPFSIPFYGDHVSLFTLLMTVSSLLLAIYSKQMTGGQEMAGPNGQVMKWMPYIMPIMFLGWFNNFAAGLTFYYFFSNMLSLLQQFVIQKFFINEEKIHAKIKANRNKPAATSKWQQRLEEMQKQQQNRK
ncbi:Membrane protein insertase YidC [compost metagenome]